MKINTLIVGCFLVFSPMLWADGYHLTCPSPEDLPAKFSPSTTFQANGITWAYRRFDQFSPAFYNTKPKWLYFLEASGASGVPLSAKQSVYCTYSDFDTHRDIFYTISPVDGNVYLLDPISFVVKSYGYPQRNFCGNSYGNGQLYCRFKRAD